MAKQHRENIHDKFFKSSFSIKEVALGFVYEFLPKDISSVIISETFELQATSYVDKNLNEKIADIIYKVKTSNETELYISFLFEHKSYSDKYSTIQILRYILNGWEKQLKQEQQLHLILPILVYHGEHNWHPKPIEDFIPIPNPFFSKYIPKFDFEFIDINRFSEKRLLDIAHYILLRNTMMTLKFGRNEKYILAHIQKMFLGHGETINDLVITNFLESIFVYITKANQLKEDKLNIIIEILENPIKNVIMTAYDRLIEKGRKEGRKVGNKSKLKALI